MRTRVLTALWLVLGCVSAHADLWIGTTLNGTVCKGTPAAHGPYDYYAVNDPTDARWEEGRLWEIDDIHYGKGVGHANETPFTQFSYQLASSEFDYTLRAIPNHPEALMAVTNLHLKARRIERANAGMLFSSSFPPPECYMQRAIGFQPKAAYLPMLYGNFLYQIGRHSLALEQYQAAIELSPDNPEIHYNLGLCYVALGDLEKASEHADLAYAAGFPLPGLKNKLARASSN